MLTRAIYSSLLLSKLFDFIGGRTRTRTLDPLIKSQLLYHLSYAPSAALARGLWRARQPGPRPCGALAPQARPALQRVLVSGCSSVVEQKLPKLRVEGSIPFTRSSNITHLGSAAARPSRASPARGALQPIQVAIQPCAHGLPPDQPHYCWLPKPITGRAGADLRGNFYRQWYALVTCREKELRNNSGSCRSAGLLCRDMLLRRSPVDRSGEKLRNSIPPCGRPSLRVSRDLAGLSCFGARPTWVSSALKLRRPVPAWTSRGCRFEGKIP